MTSSGLRLRLVDFLAVATVAGVVAAIGAPGAGSARAQAAPVSYEAVAGADGLRLEVRTPGLFLTNLFDGGLPVAQAESDSLGTSRSFAAMPYPGESVAAVSSLLLPLIGLPALPPYPLQASATYPSSPEQKVSAGAFVADADSRAEGASAAVTAGVSAGGNQGAYLEVSAETHADPDTGEVVARATTLVQGAAIAGVIGVGKVESSAEVQGGPDGEPEVDSTFEVEGLSIAGVRVAVTDEGIELLSPDALPLPDLGLQAVLDAAGVGLEYLHATEIEGGVISAGLEVTFPAPLPPPYDLTLTVTLGRVRAVADVSASGPGGSVDLGGPAPAGGSQLPVVGPSAGGTGSPSVAPPSVSPRTRTVSSLGPLEVSAASFYLVLVAAAIVALLSVALIRRSGVKLAWRS